MSGSRDSAKRLLQHYMEMALTRGGHVSVDPDMITEIRAIVDEIIDAAVEELAQRISDQHKRGLMR